MFYNRVMSREQFAQAQRSLLSAVIITQVTTLCYQRESLLRFVFRMQTGRKGEIATILRNLLHGARTRTKAHLTPVTQFFMLFFPAKNESKPET